MPNWCTNEIELQGTETQLNAVKGLIVNKLGDIDFDVLRPTPHDLLGFVVNDQKEIFELNKSRPNRLGKLRAAVFRDVITTKYLETNEKAYSIKNIYSLMSGALKDDFLFCDEPVEVIVENYIKNKLPEKNSRVLFGTDERGVIMSEIFNALQADFKQGQVKSEVSLNADCNTWRRQNWGTKYNAQNDCDQDGNASYVFSTAWTAPMYWFEELSDAIERLSLKVRMTLTYAEINDKVSGFVIRDTDGSMVKHTMTDYEIKRFLRIEEDNDEDDNYD